jgi:flagellar basal body-associated protein FliL
VKITDLPEKKAHRIIYITLLSTAGLLIIVLITGTIFGLARRSAEPVNQVRSEPVQRQGDDIRIFSGLGRLRIALADSSIMILSISFPYLANDIAFTEELAVKVNDFKIIASEYFMSLGAQALIRLDEEAAKKEILRRFNDNLRLGRIEVLYFHDLMIIDAL